MNSKYVDVGTHTFAEFAVSPKGTVAKFYLVPGWTVGGKYLSLSKRPALSLGRYERLLVPIY